MTAGVFGVKLQCLCSQHQKYLLECNLRSGKGFPSVVAVAVQLSLGFKRSSALSWHRREKVQGNGGVTTPAGVRGEVGRGAWGHGAAGDWWQGDGWTR